MPTKEESAAPPVLGPILRALTEQRASIWDAMDDIHSSIVHPGQSRVTWIPHIQSMLCELLTEHMETIDSMEALMHTEGLECWYKLQMAQLEGEYLIEKANATIQSGNAYLRDMEDLDLQTAADSRQQTACLLYTSPSPRD